MLTTVAVVLLVLWVLGMVSSTTMGGLIHVFERFEFLAIGHVYGANGEPSKTT
jgi:hypothetical protein